MKELERRLRVADMVIKFLTVRIDEKLKRIEKRKKAREKRAARKPAAPVPQAVSTSPLLPGEPPHASPGAPGRQLHLPLRRRPHQHRPNPPLRPPGTLSTGAKEKSIWQNKEAAAP